MTEPMGGHQRELQNKKGAKQIGPRATRTWSLHKLTVNTCANSFMSYIHLIETNEENANVGNGRHSRHDAQVGEHGACAGFYKSIMREGGAAPATMGRSTTIDMMMQPNRLQIETT